MQLASKSIRLVEQVRAILAASNLEAVRRVVLWRASFAVLTYGTFLLLPVCWSGPLLRWPNMAAVVVTWVAAVVVTWVAAVAVTWGASAVSTWVAAVAVTWVGLAVSTWAAVVALTWVAAISAVGGTCPLLMDLLREPRRL